MIGPYSYEFINSYNAQIEPSTVHCNNTNLVWYFKRYLLDKTMNVFKWTLPEWWNKDYFRYVLYCMGYITIVNTDRFGVIPQLSGLRGYNVFYAPTHAIITNPHINGILEPEIDSQCVVIKLTHDYMGIGDLISYYADMMALCAEGAGMNIVNSKLAYIAGAKNKAMAEALKKMGFTVTDSKANFLFVESSRISGKELYLKLKERGILVRHFDKPRLENRLRITVGSDQQMDALLTALRQLGA